MDVVFFLPFFVVFVLLTTKYPRKVPLQHSVSYFGLYVLSYFVVLSACSGSDAHFHFFLNRFSSVNVFGFVSCLEEPRGIARSSRVEVEYIQYVGTYMLNHRHRRRGTISFVSVASCWIFR